MKDYIHINKESDFDFVLNAFANGMRIDLAEQDFRLVFFTSGKPGYECNKMGETLTNLSIEGEKIRCIFDNHNLGEGVLKVKVYQEIANGLYQDGYKREVTPQELPIILWQGKSDDAPSIEIDLFLSALGEIKEKIEEIQKALTWNE